MAREAIINLQRTLIRILESLAKTAPLAATDSTSIRNAALAGLPTVDLAPLLANCDCTIPRWALVVPGTAPWMARRTLENRLAAQLEQYVKLYNTQIQAWLRESIAQLVGPYRSQSEVFREQLRRMTTLEAESGETADTAQLVADLRELEDAGAEEKEIIAK